MFDYYRDNSVPAAKATRMTPEELNGRIVVGELVEASRPVLDEELERVRRELRERSGNNA